MAGAGQPWLMPLFWPVGNIFYTLRCPEDEKVPYNPAVPLLDISGHLTAFVASLRSFIMGWFCVYTIPFLMGEKYPGLGAAKVLEWSWIWPLFVRNIIGTWIICGFWDWFLYFSPMKDKLRKYKMNAKYPSPTQMKHDFFWTTQASCCAALIEILLCHGWAKGMIPADWNIFNSPIINIIAILTLTHVRFIHFYFIHRGMHPWKTTFFPDIGSFLYTYVHSLHHKSFNPTSFSGTSMHTVEALVYYTAAFVPCCFGLHPAIAVATIIECALGAWLAHDGFQWPGSCDLFHQLHHEHFDCNYGLAHVPLDWMFGTFAGSMDDIKKIWKNQKAGREANKTPVHPDLDAKKET